MEYYGVIYCITCLVNNKQYIGQTKQKNHKKYFYKHLYNAYKDESQKNRVIYRAIRKYGKENFKWEIIDYCNSKQHLDEMEKYYINKFGTYINFLNSKGYNCTLGGDGGKGSKWSDESKIK